MGADKQNKALAGHPKGDGIAWTLTGQGLALTNFEEGFAPFGLPAMCGWKTNCRLAAALSGSTTTVLLWA